MCRGNMSHQGRRAMERDAEQQTQFREGGERERNMEDPNHLLSFRCYEY